MANAKNFFKKAGLWFKNHAPSKRRLIQIYTALLYNANIKGFVTGNIYQGNTKKLCTPGLNCYSCPGAVGACPLGSLQDSLANSNTTAPYYILGILGLLGLIFARTICGFFCPVGLGQELLYKIKTPKLKKSRYTRLLSYLKYILLIVLVIAIPLIYNGIPAFCKYICPAGTFGGAGGLLSNTNNANLYDQLGYLFTWKFCLLVAFIVACIFIYRCFCRFFCPLGAIYGFFNKIALIGVKLDKSKCVDCGMCIQTCKMDIRHVGDHECINCGECIPVCPTKAISWRGSKLVLAGIDTSVPEEEKPVKMPLKAVTADGAPAQEEAAENAEIAVVLPEENVQSTEQDAIEAQAEAVRAKIKKRSFWLQFSAWAVALAVLVAALVFYNFFDASGAVPDTVYKEGDVCPEYTFSTIYDTAGGRDNDGNLLEGVNIADFKGSVTVINFWYTKCDPCIKELPDFQEAKEKYGEDLNVVVVHIIDSASDEDIQYTIDTPIENKKGSWSDYDLIFTHDTGEANCYKTLGGTGICPMTVIVDKDGVISFKYVGYLSDKTYNDMPLLDYAIESALNK